MDKENVVYLYNGLLLNLNKEGNPDIYDTMMNLEDMLSEICQSQEEQIVKFIQIIKAENGDCQGLGVR